MERSDIDLERDLDALLRLHKLYIPEGRRAASLDSYAELLKALDALADPLPPDAEPAMIFTLDPLVHGD